MSMSTRWSGKALAEMLAELAATAKERPGMSNDLRVCVDLDRALWERIAVLRSVVERERAEAAAPPAPPPAPPPEHDEGGGATVTAMTAKRRRARKP